VDDILAIIDKEEAERIRAHLVAKFGTMLFEMNGRLSYLGMEIEILDQGTRINMSFYVKQILKDAKEKLAFTMYESPCARNVECTFTQLWQNCSTWPSVQGWIY